MKFAERCLFPKRARNIVLLRLCVVTVATLAGTWNGRLVAVEAGGQEPTQNNQGTAKTFLYIFNADDGTLASKTEIQ